MEDDKRSHPVAEVRTLFCESSNDGPVALDHFAVEQRKDPEVLEIIEYAEDREVPVDPHRARRLVSEGSAQMAWLTTWTQSKGIGELLCPASCGNKYWSLPIQTVLLVTSRDGDCMPLCCDTGGGFKMLSTLQGHEPGLEGGSSHPLTHTCLFPIPNPGH